MNMPVLSVRDSLVGFGSPFTSVNKDVAIRGFTNSIIRAWSDENDPVSPEDLSLFMVGEFDTDSGTISGCEPCVLARGTAILTQYRNNLGSDFNFSGGDSVNDI